MPRKPKYPMSDILREAIERGGWTNADLGRAAGWEESTIHYLVTGQRGSLDVARAVANVLGLKVEDVPEFQKAMDRDVTNKVDKQNRFVSRASLVDLHKATKENGERLERILAVLERMEQSINTTPVKDGSH